MTRTEIMDIAKEIQTEWIALDNEWIDDKPKSVQLYPDRPWIHTIVQDSHWKKEIPDELKKKISSLMGTLVDFAPVNTVASDELRKLFKRGGMESVDWKECDDQTFPLFVLRNLALNYDVPIVSRIAKRDKFFETFGSLITDASRTPEESAEYHKGKANLAEWREGGCK